MITRITGSRRIALIGSAVVLAVAAVAVTIAAASGDSTKPPSNTQYRDYLNDGGSPDDQCAKPPADRTGGWMCPSPAAHT